MGKTSRILLALACGPVACPGNAIECEASLEYDEVTVSCVTRLPTCTADDPHSIATQCTEQHRQCYANFGAGAICGICDVGYGEAVDGTCVPVVDCSALDCAVRSRKCVAATDHANAICGACVTGMFVDDGVCARPNCDEDDSPGSLAAGCDGLQRVCNATASGAACGDCLFGFADRDGRCVPVVTCADLGCVEAFRSCTDSTAHGDGSCGACNAGRSEQNGVCQPIPGVVCDPAPAAGSILAGCDGENRNCVVQSEGAQCGTCKDGFIQNEQSGACESPIMCAALSCAANNRACEEDPNGHCTGCMAGYVEDGVSGDCRPAQTCAGLTCADGEECAEATDFSDAFCRVDCGPFAIWGGVRCEPCPPCDATGEVGRWPWPAATGNCICQTAPGYYYTLSAEVGTFECDGDGDGWVRESARISLESEDPALSGNARCDLRTIDRFILTNEAGETTEVMLGQPLALYESDRNDNEIILNAIWQASGLPAYGRRLAAREINRLTKVCHDLRMDYNDNGVADVEEWASRDLGPAMRPDQRPFNELAYFIELHRGWYEPPGSADYGRYVIAERSRLVDGGAGPEDRVALDYAATDGTYWRECTVLRDAEWETQFPPIGMDYAIHHDAAVPWSGMNHHSQFKCLVVDEEPDPSVPVEMTPAAIVAYGYRLNLCRAFGDPVDGVTNPATAVVDCAAVDPGTIEAGDVLWGAIPYRDHGQWAGNALYERGCVNECVEELLLCPTYVPDKVVTDCVYDGANFGKFTECVSWEICDGEDNNLNGPIDENNPEGGQICTTGGAGACSLGTTRCQSGSIVCDQNTAAATEMCNGIDDDCNGLVDDGDPEGGVIYCNTGGIGECRHGTLSCFEGSIDPGVCIQTVTPPAEETGSSGCNGLDDDCDGSVDEPPSVGCPAPWDTFYDDKDQDSYGAIADVGVCACNPDPVPSPLPDPGAPGTPPLRTATRKGDCCDKDSYSNPDAVFSRYRNACGVYDRNCDGFETKRWTSNPSSGCGICVFCGCYGSANGWVSMVQACGDTGSYYGGCDWKCKQNKFNRTQQCK